MPGSAGGIGSDGRLGLLWGIGSDARLGVLGGIGSDALLGVLHAWHRDRGLLSEPQRHREFALCHRCAGRANAAPPSPCRDMAPTASIGVGGCAREGGRISARVGLGRWREEVGLIVEYRV